MDQVENKKRYKCIKHIPFDVEISKNNANEVSYMDMIFEYCYTVNNGDIYLKNGETIITVTPEVLNHFFEEVGESEMDKVERHKELCEKLNTIYEQKNKRYGNSFGETYEKLGIISAVTRISDKYNRLVTLAMNPNMDQLDESLIDTLLDMSNYCLMTVMELEK